MIPWVREKFAERRARWIASRKRSEPSSTRNDFGSSTSFSQEPHNPSHRGNDKQNSTPKLKSEISSKTDDNNKINVRILSSTGKSTVLTIDLSAQIVDLKKEALTKFSEDNAALPLLAPNVKQLYPKYRLIRPDSTVQLNESWTLTQAGISDNDTLLLVIRRTQAYEQNLQPPTDNDILQATKDVPVREAQNPRVDIHDLIIEADLQFDVRKVIISLAHASAYIIGAGPYAPQLISMFKQKLVNKKRDQSNNLQCLVDMGYTEKKAKNALKMHNGIYSAALEWLIQHQDDSNADLDNSQISSSSSKQISGNSTNDIAGRVEALLEIVRIYSHRDVAPPPEIVHSLVIMGFDKKAVLTALKNTRNDRTAACEWLCGNRSSSLMELRDGLTQHSPILKAIMESPQVQLSLGNPKIFIAYISMLDNQNTLKMWLGDSDTSTVFSHILRKYHEEKHVLGINQFNAGR